MHDLYKYLGVSEEEVNENLQNLDRAYRNKAKAAHPDKGGMLLGSTQFLS